MSQDTPVAARSWGMCAMEPGLRKTNRSQVVVVMEAVIGSGEGGGNDGGIGGHVNIKPATSAHCQRDVHLSINILPGAVGEHSSQYS